MSRRLLTNVHGTCPASNDSFHSLRIHRHVAHFGEVDNETAVGQTASGPIMSDRYHRIVDS
jgi:hypothetical protein